MENKMRSDSEHFLTNLGEELDKVSLFENNSEIGVVW